LKRLDSRQVETLVTELILNVRDSESIETFITDLSIQALEKSECERAQVAQRASALSICVSKRIDAKLSLLDSVNPDSRPQSPKRASAVASTLVTQVTGLSHSDRAALSMGIKTVTELPK